MSLQAQHTETESRRTAMLRTAFCPVVREALEVPGRRVAVVTPDRGLARRVVHHLARWDILG